MTTAITRHIRSLRSDFTSGILTEKDVQKDPLKQFAKWMKQAVEANAQEPNAMTLATVSADGQPDARIVLLRGFSKEGFSFFTNYNSIKGQEMNANTNVCLNFFWPELQRQVRILGRVKKLSVQESDRYFATRPRESQIGAHVSHQSQPLKDREELESRMQLLSAQFAGKKVPRPKYWGGYIVVPVQLEFWQGRENRLHDRIQYYKKRGAWVVRRLNP
jgi:pyridoxamine 5'-phosphate oxidase